MPPPVPPHFLPRSLRSPCCRRGAPIPPIYALALAPSSRVLRKLPYRLPSIIRNFRNRRAPQAISLVRPFPRGLASGTRSRRVRNGKIRHPAFDPSFPEKPAAPRQTVAAPSEN